ncbi:MAG: acetate--CoA ligase family protein [DPANN group archaeon]|nr:acetate--CoA ligase family protein [DPANN group archaeon]
MVLMTEHDSKKMFSSYGISVTKEFVAKDRHEASVYAERIGYPVVMKVMSSDIVHKTDSGGVVLNIHDSDDVLRAYDLIIKNVSKSNPHAKIEGVIVEEQVAGHEIIVGAKIDPQFGPVIMVGLGGIFVEVLKDVSFRVVPITEKDADEMIHELKAFSVLEGVRGQPKADISKIIKALVAVSKLVQDNPNIQELDINPLMVDSKRAVAADARIIVD